MAYCYDRDLSETAMSSNVPNKRHVFSTRTAPILWKQRERKPAINHLVAAVAAQQGFTTVSKVVTLLL